MFQQLAICLGLLALLLSNPAVVVHAQVAPPLPDCKPFMGGRIYPSPTSAQDNTLFAAGEWAAKEHIHYLYKSSDRGLTWERLPELPLTYTSRAHIDFSTNYADDHALTVTFAHGTDLSTDGGANWRAVLFPKLSPNAFVLGDARHLFLGYGRELPPEGRQPGELQITRDGGWSWESVPTGLEVDEIAVSPAFAQDRTLLVALGAYKYNGGLIKSTDAGLTWAPADTGIILEGLGIKYLRFSPAYASDQTIFCFNYTGIVQNKIYKSTDAGNSWRFLADPELLAPPAPPGLLLSPRFLQDQTMWLAFDFSAKVSRDGGQTWQDMPYNDQIWLQAAAEYCRPAGECGVEVFGTSWQKGATWEDDRWFMYRSYDYGQTWQCLEDPTLPQEPTPTPPPPVEIPEPATGLLLVGGLVALVGVARRRSKIRPDEK